MAREVRGAPHPRRRTSISKASRRQLQGQAQLFFSLYFAMTGLHALHMVIGVGILIVLIVQAHRGSSTPEYYHAGGRGRTLLALRGHHLDLPVPAAVPDRSPHGPK